MGLSARPEQLGAMDEYMHHRHCFNCFDVEAMIVRAGLRVVEKQGLLIKTLPNDAFIHCTDDQLRGLVRLGLDLPMEYAAVSYFLCQTGA
jgi:hypothetical protein